VGFDVVDCGKCDADEIPAVRRLCKTKRRHVASYDNEITFPKCESDEPLMTETTGSRQLSHRAILVRLLCIAGLGIAAWIWFFSQPPMPQSQSYHDFADQRVFLGVPHFLNVISNFPFLLVAGWGLCFLLCHDRPTPRNPFLDSRERWPYVLFFIGVGFTAFGSAYYHLQPDNDRLLWDRLPMTVAFMALFAGIVAERLNPRIGLFVVGPLVAFGFGSVFYWHWTEQHGRGDLRPYYFVQFSPLLVLPVLLLLFPPGYTRTLDILIALGMYILAKYCEHPMDRPIFDLGGWVSGHTLKHLLAALSAFWILRMLGLRRQALVGTA
jgi:hypothetical protein